MVRLLSMYFSLYSFSSKFLELGWFPPHLISQCWSRLITKSFTRPSSILLTYMCRYKFSHCLTKFYFQPCKKLAFSIPTAMTIFGHCLSLLALVQSCCCGVAQRPLEDHEWSSEHQAPSQVLSGDMGWRPIWKLLGGNPFPIGEITIIIEITENSKGYVLLRYIFNIFYLLCSSKFDHVRLL